MIVPSMTFDEIRKEIEKDFKIVFRKAEYVTKDLTRFHSPLNNKRITRFYDYYSKYKNNWIYEIDLSKRQTILTFMVYYYGEKGLNAFEMMQFDNFMLFFTAHFFKRYNERRNLNLTLPTDIIRSYMLDNTHISLETLEVIDVKIAKMMCVTDSGVVLGIYNKNINIIKMNTFLTNDMMKGEQVDKHNELKEKLDKYVNENDKYE